MFYRLFIFGLAVLLAAGCVSKSARSPAADVETPDFVLHKKVGSVVAVNAGNQTAVVRLDDMAKAAPDAQTLLVARDLELAYVASLMTAPLKQGRFFTVYCRSGELRVGDGVYFPEFAPEQQAAPMGTDGAKGDAATVGL